MTQADLARKTGIQQSAISALVNNGRHVGPEKLVLVARALGVARGDLHDASALPSEKTATPRNRHVAQNLSEPHAQHALQPATIDEPASPIDAPGLENAIVQRMLAGVFMRAVWELAALPLVMQQQIWHDHIWPAYKAQTDGGDPHSPGDG